MANKVQIQFEAASNSVPVNASIIFPDGAVGQPLVRTADGFAWADPDMALEEATASMVLTDEGSNALQAVTTYVDADSESDDFVVDAIIVALNEVPAGTTLSIDGIAGSYVAPAPQKIFWLSDILKAHNSALPTRTKLTGHTGGSAVATFKITISELPDDLVTAVTVKVVASNTADLEGTNQATMAMEDYVVMAEEQIAVSLTASAE